MEKSYFYYSRSTPAISIKATSLFCICKNLGHYLAPLLFRLLPPHSSYLDILELPLVATGTSRLEHMVRSLLPRPPPPKKNFLTGNNSY